jgi:hypothetical protein
VVGDRGGVAGGGRVSGAAGAVAAGGNTKFTLLWRRFAGILVLPVQCKHYCDTMVGEKVIRELKGIVATRHAAGGIVVTCGRFTRGAVRFGREAGIELVDGAEMVGWCGRGKVRITTHGI